MPDWDECNIWVGDVPAIPEHLQRVWGKALEDANYLVDLSTLTHLCKVPPEDLLRPLGFEPKYVVCTRAPGPRWTSAWAHMVRKRAEKRCLREYIRFYEEFVGLSRSDIRELEGELIERDLKRGLKSPRGIIGAEYFENAFPHGFTTAISDPAYQFRYFGETIDMLEKRPDQYVELPLEEPDKAADWISQAFGIEARQVPERSEALNRNSTFNAIRHHPAIANITRHIPRALRQSVARRIEASSLLSGGAFRSADPGLEKEMASMVTEMLDVPDRA